MSTRFALPCKISLTRPTVSCRSLPTCIFSVPETAKQHSVVPPTNQSVSSFSAWVQARQVVSFRAVLNHVASILFSRPSDILLSTEQPESTPRVSCPTTQVSTDCRIDFAVACWVVFKVFPCRLWVVGKPSPFPPVALTSRRCWLVVTLLSSVNTTRQDIYRFPAGTTWR